MARAHELALATPLRLLLKLQITNRISKNSLNTQNTYNTRNPSPEYVNKQINPITPSPPINEVNVMVMMMMMMQAIKYIRMCVYTSNNQNINPRLTTKNHNSSRRLQYIPADCDSDLRFSSSNASLRLFLLFFFLLFLVLPLLGFFFLFFFQSFDL